MTDDNLYAAIRRAKTAAGLDPDRAYLPVEWADHLDKKWARAFWRTQLQRVFEARPGDRARHNHFTRDVKKPGICPRCDQLAR